MALILTADDDDATRLVIRTVLERAGHTVVEAVNGLQALEVLDTLTGPPDLILLDLVMPVLDGAAVLDELRQRGLTVPVLLVSAFLDQIGADFGPPVSGGLPKPFGADELMQAVEAVLGTARTE